MDYTLYSAEDFAADESFINHHFKSDDEAVSFWENWKTHHPEKLDEIYHAERLLDLMTLQLSDEEIKFEYSRLEEFLTEANQQPVNIANKKIFNNWALVSAVCIAFLVLGISAFWLNSKQKTLPALEMVSRNNPFGQRSIIILSDGTKVTLNANSSIEFPKVFAKDKRVINLIGEAFFEVTKNKHHPFQVKTGKVTTTVWGTKFNVNNNLPDSAIQIALVEGKITVSETNKTGEILLKPNEMLTYSKETEQFVKSSFETKQLTAWKDGNLFFKNASFNDVALKIYNTYGVTLRNANKKTNWSYTGEFYNSDYLTVIKSICYAKNLEYKISNDTITIK